MVGHAGKANVTTLHRRKFLYTVILMTLTFVLLYILVFDNGPNLSSAQRLAATLSSCESESTISATAGTETTNRPHPRRILIAETGGRLGNQMYMYAVLLATARYNHRESEAFMCPKMSSFLTKYFNVTMPSLPQAVFNSINWRKYFMFQEDVGPLRKLTKQHRFMSLYRWTHNKDFFHEFESDLRNEFKFHDHIQQRTSAKLSEAGQNVYESGSKDHRENVTLVGVHVRAKDWILHSQIEKYNVPNVSYYLSAMEYFNSKYSNISNVVFVVASNDIPWCKEQFKSSTKELLNIYYLDGTSEEDGGLDMSVLTKCDHVIIGAPFGTFSFWSAYLNKGEVVYCLECFPNWSRLVYRKEQMVLPSWKGISMNGNGSVELEELV